MSVGWGAWCAVHMFAKWLMSVVSNVLALALAVGACVGGVAMPASAAPADDGPVSVQDEKPRASGTLHVRGEEVALEPAKIVEKTNLVSLLTYYGVQPNPGGVQLEWSPYSTGVQGRVAYQIRQLGNPTPYWIQIGFFGLNLWGDSSASCEVFEGEPGTAGAEVTWESGFQCVTKQRGLDRDWDFSIRPTGVLAKSSGTITPGDGLSLTEGTYLTDGPYHRDGEAEVPAAQSARFFTVLTNRDDPFYENQARMEFSYQIVEDGKKTGFWAAGVSTNFSGKVFYSADGRCAIYNRNPLEGPGRLDGMRPVQGSGYSCMTESQFKDDPAEIRHIHFDATFLVGKQ